MGHVLMILFLWCSPGGTAVPSGQVKDVVTQYVHSACGVPPEDITLEFRRIPTHVTASTENYSIRVAADAPGVMRGNVSMPVEIVGDGVVERRCIVSVKIRRFGNAYFAARQLPQHGRISAEDVIVQRVETTSFPADFVSGADQLSGKRTKRIVSSGSLVCESLLEDVPLVNPHDQVNLIVRTKSVAISVNAVAMESGRLGELVTVERPGVRGTFRAKVMNEKTVELRLDY